MLLTLKNMHIYINKTVYNKKNKFTKHESLKIKKIDIYIYINWYKIVNKNLLHEIKRIIYIIAVFVCVGVL